MCLIKFTQQEVCNSMINLSVVIPSFNEEERIERCLLSLMNQTLLRDNYEVIVC